MHLTQLLNRDGGPRETISVSPDDPLVTAARLLHEHGIGALPVMIPETEQLVGILSERDIVRVCCDDPARIASETVSSAMTETVFTADKSDDLHKILRLMHQNRIRHLPVVEGQKLVGIVSIRDILDALFQDAEVKIHHLSDYLGGTYGSRVY